MIERLITNPLTLKRWRKFKKIRRASFAVWAFCFMLIISLTAEIWANSKPLIMSYQGKIYFPIIKSYHPTEFNIEDIFVMDYRRLEFSNTDWAIWPPVKWDPYESNKDLAYYPGAPTKLNIMGTDDRGRDVFARLLYGFRFSIGYALLVWFFTFSIGTAIGAIMGFFGGNIDLIGQRLVEIFESIPILPLLILLVALLGSSFSLLVIMSIIMGWMMISIYIRAEVLKLRKRDFVEAARAIGVSRLRLIFTHILPNALGPVLTFTPFVISGGIASLAVLDFLGFGLPPPTPSWGELLNQAQKSFTIAWWLAVYPGLALFFSVLVLNLIGEGVRDAFDPRK